MVFISTDKSLLLQRAEAYGADAVVASLIGVHLCLEDAPSIVSMCRQVGGGALTTLCEGESIYIHVHINFALGVWQSFLWLMANWRSQLPSKPRLWAHASRLTPQA